MIHDAMKVRKSPNQFHHIFSLRCLHLLAPKPVITFKHISIWWRRCQAPKSNGQDTIVAQKNGGKPLRCAGALQSHMHESSSTSLPVLHDINDPQGCLAVALDFSSNSFAWKVQHQNFWKTQMGSLSKHNFNNHPFCGRKTIPCFWGKKE